MKLLNNKYLYIFLLGVSGMFASCGNDEDDYSAGMPTATDCPALTFGSDNTESVELDPAAPTTAAITVFRGKTDTEASYSIRVLSNTDNIFTVPQTVNFAAGAEEAAVTVSFNNAEVGKSYTLEIGLDEGDVDAYSSDTYTSYVYTCIRVKWNTIGKGQWLDGFWYGFWDEVNIQQRDDIPGVYRINNPYTDELVSSTGETTATYTDYLVFTLSETGYVSWDTSFYINTAYDGSTEIKGYYPSALGSSLASSNELSYAETDDEGNIRYFTITPYWYVDGVGGWGTDYPCYLAFPGVDLATDWEW